MQLKIKVLWKQLSLILVFKQNKNFVWIHAG